MLNLRSKFKICSQLFSFSNPKKSNFDNNCWIWKNKRASKSSKNPLNTDSTSFSRGNGQTSPFSLWARSRWNIRIFPVVLWRDLWEIKLSILSGLDTSTGEMEWWGLLRRGFDYEIELGQKDKWTFVFEFDGYFYNWGRETFKNYWFEDGDILEL